MPSDVWTSRSKEHGGLVKTDCKQVFCRSVVNDHCDKYGLKGWWINLMNYEPANRCKEESQSHVLGSQSQGPGSSACPRRLAVEG